MCKLVSLVPSEKKCHPRKMRQTKCLLFNVWMIKLIKTPIAKLPSAKWLFLGITVNFIIKKLKSKHLVCLSFLWWQVLREREKIFYTYSGPRTELIASLYNGAKVIFLNQYKSQWICTQYFSFQVCRCSLECSQKNPLTIIFFWNFICKIT